MTVTAAMKKNIRPYLGHHPKIDATCYIDDMAVVIGDTEVQGRLAVLKPLRGEGEQRTLAASDLPAAVAALLTAA